MAHDHDHGQEHEHEDDHSHLDAMELRVRALESVLAQKGYIEPAALDEIIEAYQTRVGPRNGARVVARAWVDAGYRDWLLRDATAAIASLGYAGRQGEHMRVVENTAERHHLVVCTLCSCYPWPVLGLPPVWYKSAPYRARAVRDPRGVLADFGVALPAGTEIRVWDSTAELRYLVLPQQPAGSEHLSEDELAALVTRDSMIGTGLPPVTGLGMNYVNHADLGGQPGHGAVEPEPEGDPFHAAWEPRAHALTVAMGATGSWNIDISRAARETLPDYDSLSYYEKWLGGLERLLDERGLARADEIAQGRMLHRPLPVARVLRAADVAAALARGAPTERATDQSPRFEIGAAVRMRSQAVPHHTRLPAYARGRRGRVEARHGAHVFADSHAQGLGEQPCWLYTVVFDGVELWGDEAAGGDMQVSIDAWEPYLEPAE